MNEEFIICHLLFFVFFLLFWEEKNLQIEIWEFQKSIVRRPVVDHWPSSHAQMSSIRHFIVWRINIRKQTWSSEHSFHFKEKTIYHSILYIIFSYLCHLCAVWCGVNVRAFLLLLLLLSRRFFYVNLIIDGNLSNINMRCHRGMISF